MYLIANRLRRPAAAIYALILLTAGAYAPRAAGATLQPDADYAEICTRVAERLPRLHLLHMELDDNVAARAWTNLLASFDFERLYFLQSDIDTFEKREYELDDDVKVGRMALALDVFDVFKERLSNRVAYVETLLSTNFDWNVDESYVWQRKDAPWPKDEAEWNDLWRKKIKNEVLRILISRQLDEEEAAAASNTVSSLSNGGITNVTGLSITGSVDLAAADTGGVAVIALSTNELSAVSTGVVAVAEPPPEDPEAIVRKRYERTLTIVQDSDAEWVLQKYLSAIAQAYDPHSVYYPPSALEDFQIEMRLSLYGIGALLSAEDGAAKIVRLIPGGPAAKDTREKRLQPGDKIIAVAQDKAESVDILHWPLHKIVGLIRGEKGTRVVLTVIPATDPGGSKLKTVDLVRDEVKLEEQAATGSVRRVTASNGSAHKLGIVRLPTFYANMEARSPDDPGFRSAVYDVAKIIEEQKAEDVDGILLDLRGNGGGSLLEAIDMAGLFIRRGPTVQVKERFGIRALDDEDPRVAYRGPMVVLVNRLSASASEIVAGALQDYGRAVIVGDSKTHGKGSVQSVVDLGHDEALGALKITTACYYRISGATTQLRGVTPDIIVPSPWDFMETGEEFLPNAMPSAPEQPAAYQPVADLSGIIPTLREESERRRRENPEFQTYGRFLERIARMNEDREVPLEWNTRLRFAETERELSNIQEELTADAEADGEPSEDAAEAADLVLSEGLSILADMVSLQPRMAFEDPPASLPRSLAEWLKLN